ncbi:YwaF family protein [Paenibacillus kobensis]|uniref:YwaF family protein n=1 Tax=Paenibacillus kobensis TaxID=59841 RepID=UPI0013E32171|nr:TIGR02206 family membrane protein [Paenibacillus kobensis]
MRFVPYSAEHWAALIGCAAVCIALIVFRKPLREGNRSRWTAVSIALLMALLEAGLYFTYMIHHEWSVWTLPFELCTMSLWLSVVMLLTRSRLLYQILFYLGTLGALQALLTPDLDVTFPAFRYFHFFLGHIGILAASVYMTAVERMRPALRFLPVAVLALHIAAIPGGIVNYYAGTNYMFLARKPAGGSLLDWLGPWPWYLIALEPIVWLMCLLLFGLVTGADRMGKRVR